MAETTSLTVRVPAELAEALRTYAYVTNTSVNEAVKSAIVDMLRSKARTEMVKAAFEATLRDHAIALDKLGHL
jgi:hypothetical protein